MAYSYVVYTGNGSTTQFAITFPYIRKEHVKVYVNYVDTAYTYVNDTTVQLAAAPASPLRVEVRRVTPLSTRLVDYTDGSTLVAADLDTSNLQSLYNEQELDDNQKRGIFVDDATGLITAGGQRITNVGNPTSAQDAATKTYVDTADALKVAKAGDTMSGALAMGSNKITDLGTPTANADAATKLYVDTVTLAGNVPDGDRGDITVSGVGTSWAIDAGAVTETKLGTGAVTSTKILDGTILDADVNATAGIVASKLSFLQAGASAVARTVDSKLKDVVSVKDFGAVGDGVTDDTAKIQAAVDAAPTGGVVDGLGLLYLVTSVNLKSNLVFRNFRFKTKGGAVDFVSPVTIGAWYDTNLRTQILVENVHVDGNRINQTNIGQSEDGGRHGFRLIGNVSNVTIRDCSATYCASDGIILYAGIETGPTASAPFCNNILVQNCVFEWSRRHGMSMDCADNITFEKCTFSNNGQDLNGTDPLNSGGRGARNGGYLYGNGGDIEGYGVGSAISNIRFLECIALQNVRDGFTFYDPVLQTDAGFVVSQNILLSGCLLDKGNGTGGAASTYCLTFTGGIANKALGPIYSNITLRDNYFKDMILLRSVDKVNLEGGLIGNNGSVIGQLDYATNITVGQIQRSNLFFAKDTSTVTYPFLPVDSARLLQGVGVTIANGATLDLGFGRTTTFGILTVFSRGSTIFGGQFAADIFLAAGGGIFISDIYNSGQIGTTSSDKLQVITSASNWQLKNNEPGGNAMAISYYLMI